MNTLLLRAIQDDPRPALAVKKKIQCTAPTPWQLSTLTRLYTHTQKQTPTHTDTQPTTITVKIQTEFYARSSYRAPTGSASPVENPCYKTLKVHGFTAHNSDLFTHTEDETKVTCLSYFVGCKRLSWSSCMHVSSLK